MTQSFKPTEQTAIDRIADECLAFRARLLSRTLTNLYDDAFRPLGLTAGQMNILVMVAKRGPIAPGEAAKGLSMEKSTLSRNVERMRSNGWLTVLPGETGRQQLLQISPAGRKLLLKALPLWSDAQARATDLLGERGAQSIQRTVKTVRDRKGRG